MSNTATVGRRPATTASTQRPLLKWPGGKRALLSDMLPLVPGQIGRYFEPFLGGGALFFAVQPPMALLSDNNADLINCYLQVRDHPEDVIRHLSRLRNTEDAYYETRSRTPRCDAAKAARIIYLTTLAFNGIYRVNLRGEFNVPYGHKAHLKPFDPESIEAASRALLSARFRCADFEAATAAAMCGDFVYFDPPYTVAHGNNGFLKYNSRIFSWEDQVRLGEVAARLARRGCKVVVSNADHPSIMRLYKGFRVKRVERTSRIAASAAFRRRVSECIFHSGG